MNTGAHDPLLEALGQRELAAQEHARRVEDAVDRGDVEALAQLTGRTKAQAAEMLEALRPPDLATREAWLDRYEDAKKTRKLPLRVAWMVAPLAAAAVIAALFLSPPKNVLPVPALSAEITSAPSPHLSAAKPVEVAPSEVHRDVAGDLLRITVGSESAQPAELEALAFWQRGDHLISWPVVSNVERDDDTHATISVRIPDDTSGEGRLILLVAAQGALPDQRRAEKECLSPSADAPWQVVRVSPAIAVEPNVSRKEK